MLTFEEAWNNIQGLGEPRMLEHYGATVIFEVLTTRRSVSCIEIGCHLGRSAIFMGQLLKQWNGTLISFDPYQAITVQDLGDLENRTPDQEYGTALMNIDKKNLSGTVSLIRATSEKGSQGIENNTIDFIYIDGDHSIEGVTTDIDCWKSKLKSGATILIDDWEAMCSRVPMLPSDWEPLTVTGHVGVFRKS